MDREPRSHVEMAARPQWQSARHPASRCGLWLAAHQLRAMWLVQSQCGALPKTFNLLVVGSIPTGLNNPRPNAVNNLQPVERQTTHKYRTGLVEANASGLLNRTRWYGNHRA